jgi:hypothetical protein
MQMEENKMQTLWDELYNLVIWDNPIPIHKKINIENKMTQVSIIDFIVYLYLEPNDDFNNRALIFLIDYWQDLTLNDWKEIVYRCSNSGGALYYLFIFTYTFIKIDLIAEYAKMKGVNEKVRKICLVRYKKSPDIFFIWYKDLATDLLKLHGKDIEELKNIRKNLLNQGAKLAEPVVYPQKQEDGTFKIFIPKSWEWVKDY